MKSIDAEVGEQTIQHEYHTHQRLNERETNINSIDNSLLHMGIDPHDSVIFDQYDS